MKKKVMKLKSKSPFPTSKIFDEKLVAIHKIKKTLTLNRLAYMGMCILDLSKTLMYDFYDNYSKKKYNDEAKLLFTDTDSLTYGIKTEDHIKIFGVLRINSIIVNIQKTPHILINQTKEVIGKFKGEVSGTQINEFIGLRSKMYSYLKDTD